MAKEDIKIKGNYDDEAERLIKETQAAAVVLMVLDGTKGSGFSVSGVEGNRDSVIVRIPAILRHMADEIQKDIDQRKNQ